MKGDPLIGVDPLTHAIIGAAIQVHSHLGPGLLESTYSTCLAYELGLGGLKVEEQKALPLSYKDVLLDCGYRMDLVVEDQVIVEVKSVAELLPIYDAQILTYLKLYGSNMRGLLINFNVRLLKDGIRRFRC